MFHRRSLLKWITSCLVVASIPWRARAQNVLQLDVLPVMQFDYQVRLRSVGIPADPAQRTPAQEKTAGLMFWAVRNMAALQSTTVTQEALESIHHHS